MEIVDIGFKIKKINDKLQKKADKTMEELDITFSQHHILVYLIHLENKTCSLKTLEKEFKVSQATMAGLIKRMEEKEIVKTHIGENDKRIKMVTITEKGILICQKSREMMMKGEETIKSIYSQEELNNLTNYLERLYKILDKEDKKC